jgi:hypothetical protein
LGLDKKTIAFEQKNLFRVFIEYCTFDLGTTMATAKVRK